jgi:putative flippase GtrA
VYVSAAKLRGKYAKVTNRNMQVIFPVQQIFQLPIVRFVIVGGFNTALTYGVYCFFLYLGFHYQAALLCEYSVGICVGYVLNRYWTFGDQKSAQPDKTATSFVRYATTYGGVYIGNVVLLSLIVEMGWLSPMIGQIIALAIISLASFIMQKYWVFAGSSKHRDL